MSILSEYKQPSDFTRRVIGERKVDERFYAVKLSCGHKFVTTRRAASFGGSHRCSKCYFDWHEEWKKARNIADGFGYMNDL